MVAKCVWKKYRTTFFGPFLKSYLRVPKTVTREEAYKGGQKLQTYGSTHDVMSWVYSLRQELGLLMTS